MLFSFMLLGLALDLPPSNTLRPKPKAESELQTGAYRSFRRPRVLFPQNDPNAPMGQGDDLGLFSGKHWVGVGGRAYAFAPELVKPAPPVLSELIASCLRTKSPQHRSCFLESAKRSQALRKQLAKNLQDPRHPLHVPPRANGPANQARKALFSKLERLAAALDKLGKANTAPRAQHKTKIVKQLRELVDGMIAFTSLQRGRFGLAVRGGTSMGTYQAGFLYYFSEFLKTHAQRWGQENPSKPPDSQRRLLSHFESATGSSAGALNALLLASEGCKTPQLTPQSSAFYKAWLETGMVGRHGSVGLASSRRRPGHQLGFLSKTPIEVAARRVEKDLNLGKIHKPGCAVDLGFTVTRAQHDRMPLFGGHQRAPNIEIHRTLERFAFSLRFQPDPHHATRQVLQLRNRRPSPAPHRFGLGGIKDKDRLDAFYLAYGSPSHYQSALDPQAVIETALASGAMPFAFAPQSLPYTAFRPDGEVDREHSGRADFVDGGILDGRPLAFAVDLQEWKRADDTKRAVDRLTQTSGEHGLDRNRQAWKDELHLGLTAASRLREWQTWQARSDLYRQLRSPDVKAPNQLDHALQSWQEILDVLPATPRTLVFVEPTLATWPESQPESTQKTQSSARKRLIPAVAKHLGNFIGSAR